MSLLETNMLSNACVDWVD